MDQALKTAIKEMKNMSATVGIYFILVIIIIMVCIYYYYMSGLESRECNIMNSLYKNKNTFIKSINYAKPDYSFTLKDYYIKTAYNCCSGGLYKNDYVDTCALVDIIKQGVRCLDFEIYSMNDQPVVATSTVPNYYVKETYNSVLFSSVMEIIKSSCFDGGITPNPNDPILIHLRIKSTNPRMYDNLANILNGYKDYLLGPHYSFEYTYMSNGFQDTSSSDSGSSSNSQYLTHNLGNVNLKDLQKKIIIIVDRLNTAFMENSNFYEYVNMTSNSVFMRALSYYDVKYTPDMNELTNYNKRNMTIVLPDSGSDPENPNGLICMDMGCQLVALRYQKADTNLEITNQYFDDRKSAFVLKPENLRYIQETIKATPANPEEMSYATRGISTDYYSIQI